MDFINQYIINNYLWIQIIPAVIGLFVYHKVKKPFKYFIVVLWYSVFSEIVALYYGLNISDGVNKIFYNIYNVIYFTFLFWLFYTVFKTELFKKSIVAIASIFGLVLLYEVFIDKLDIYNQTLVMAYIAGGFGVLISVFFYLIEQLNIAQNNNIFIQFLFWIMLAHFVYYLGFTPFKMGENYFSTVIGRSDMLSIKVIITCLKSLFISIGLYGCRSF